MMNKKKANGERDGENHDEDRELPSHAVARSRSGDVATRRRRSDCRGRRVGGGDVSVMRVHELTFSTFTAALRRIRRYIEGTKTSVGQVAKSRTPMTGRASGAFCSPPSPTPNAMGIMPRIIAPAVINTGRNRVNPA